jgi:MFS family permease
MVDSSATGVRAVIPRNLILPVYLPALLFAVGQGAIIPVIPLLAREFGASVAAIGVITAMRGIGTIVFDVPAGQLVGRWGERRAMVLGTALLVVAGVGCILSKSSGAIAAFVFVLGCGWAVWLLARLSFISDTVPVAQRGRALSALGGVNRVGNFLGPFLGAGVVVLGGLRAAFILQAAVAAAGCAVLMLVQRWGGDEVDRADQGHGRPSFPAIVRGNLRVFATAGTAASCAMLLRAARQVIIPLWGIQLGLPATEISLVFGVSTGLDMLLFYPSGLISDRIGRKLVGVLCVGLLAAGLVLMPLATVTPTYVLVAMLLGVGNGIGTSIVMILGADLAPAQGRAEFLGVWRVVTDIGQAAGPLVIAAIAGLASLGFASALVGIVGLAGAAFYARFVPETLRRHELAPATPLEAMSDQATAKTSAGG